MKWYYKMMHRYYFRKSVWVQNYGEKGIVFEYYIGMARIYGRKAGIIK